MKATRKGKPSRISNLQGKKLIAFGWYGGKFSHLKWLLPLLPETSYYCEPFAGSGAAMLNRPPSGIETYNDLDGEVVNFFKVLRDQPEQLQRLMALTPFSREEFSLACNLDESLTPLERARRFYVRARQVRTGLAQTASLGRWANCKSTIRAGMSGVVSRWLGAVEQLPDIALRLMRVQIENRPAVDCIKIYDSEDTLFYCDPPYVHETRGDSKAYGYEMSDEQHMDLAKTLNEAKGLVAVSGYDCPLMGELYSPTGWLKLNFQCTNHSTKDSRTETVWLNYDPVTKRRIIQ
jgi:DNA adenine methylase